jgi:RNA polymerase subunit RPABC4/transcription elongation factor Spt4
MICSYCRSEYIAVRDEQNCRNCGAPVPPSPWAGQEILTHKDYSSGVLITTTIDLGEKDFKMRKVQK